VAAQTNKTQMTRALLALREQILSGQFVAGERMSELPLVERLGVSRTPLRLALAELEHEGLLRSLAGGGYVRSTNDGIEELVHRADYESFERYVDLNQRFHARLLRMARSPILERTLAGVVSRPFAGPSAAFVISEAELPESREVLVIAHRHHASLIESIERGEGARAESLAREHAHLALMNLDIALRHRELIERMPGASLLALPQIGGT
jgi:GntR family transcriptional regulator of vanillate catabolism